MNRENWEVKKLGEVCEITNGRNQKKVVDPNGIYPIMGSGGIMGYANDFLCPIDTVIIGRKGTINKPLFVKDNVWIVDTAFGIVANNSILNSSFLFYFCKFFDFNKLNVAVTIPSLRKIDLKEIPILIPPLPIQEAIVKELNTLHRLKELQEQQLAEYDNLAQSTFYSMFGDPIENERGWEVDCLENVCIRKGEYGAGSSAIPFDEIKPRYIRITDINESGALNVEKVSPSNKLDFEKYQLLDGDILFARSGATVGKTYLHSPENGNCIFAGYLIRFMVDRKKIIPIFLFHYTKTEFYKDWIASRQRVVAQPNINAKQYGELSVFIPPLPLQAQFADRIKKIDEQKELIKQSIAQTQMLIDYTMDKYFN